MPYRNPRLPALQILAMSLISLFLLGTGPVDPFGALQMSKPPRESQIPTFQLSTLDGTVIHSKDLQGKVILLNFWATWCGPCKEEMPALDQLRQQFDPEQFLMFAVTADIQPHAIRQFWEHLKLSIPVLLDEDEELSQYFMVRNLPTTILVGPKGMIRGHAMGPRAWNSPEAISLIRQILVPSQ